MTLRAAISLLCLGVLSLAGVACHSDGLYDPCPLSNSIKDVCSQASAEGRSCDDSADCADGLTCVDGTCSDGTAFTCVVAEHPFCLEQICASWQGAPSVCTRACVVDDDCPGTGSCVSHQGLDFCIDTGSAYEPSVFDRMGQQAAD